MGVALTFGIFESREKRFLAKGKPTTSLWLIMVHFFTNKIHQTGKSLAIHCFVSYVNRRAHLPHDTLHRDKSC